MFLENVDTDLVVSWDWWRACALWSWSSCSSFSWTSRCHLWIQGIFKNHFWKFLFQGPKKRSSNILKNSLSLSIWLGVSRSCALDERRGATVYRVMDQVTDAKFLVVFVLNVLKQCFSFNTNIMLSVKTKEEGTLITT